ncbi:MAG TPA: hypothetical protein VEB63_10010, partial [Chitinophagaceae bacterium]|nr:hypothetical protein [Chitinophagaceae bacterium]
MTFNKTTFNNGFNNAATISTQLNQQKDQNMILLKNSFGVSIGFNPKVSPRNFMDRLAGSSLERKPKSELVQLIEKDPIEALLDKKLKMDENEDE